MKARRRPATFIHQERYHANMIESTFQILDGIGKTRERRLWDDGNRLWEDLIASDMHLIPKARRESCSKQIEQAYDFLDWEDCRGLADMLGKNGENWRMYDRFRDDAAYLDIETTGLQRDSKVTVVTVRRNDRTYTLVNGEDLSSETLAESLDGAKLLVTYNGNCFDVPVLECSFPSVDLSIPQVDLRFACSKLGMRGGLKNIERCIGISRDDDISDVDGMEAVRLWFHWERAGDKEARDRLVEYNRADTVNLVQLADFVYPRLVREYAGFPVSEERIPPTCRSGGLTKNPSTKVDRMLPGRRFVHYPIVSRYGIYQFYIRIYIRVP